MNNTKLINAYLHITNACEFRCPFCYASDIHIDGDKRYFDKEKILSIIDIVGKSTVKNLSLVGGNPLLHPNIVELVEYVKSTTNLNLIMITNTADFSSSTLEKSCPMIDVLMVTVHSNTSDGHDYITKKQGSYDALIAALLKYQEINPVGEIKIAVNITPYAYNRIYETVENILRKGVKVNEVILQRIAPVSLQRMNEEFLVNANQANIALAQAIRVRNELGIKIDLVDPFPLCFVDDENKEIIVPCKCGKTDININGNGDVSRCGADPHYQLGNIFDTPLDEIWNTPELISFRNRDYLPQECAGCEQKVICGGGCPMSVIAYRAINKSHLDMFRQQNKK